MWSLYVFEADQWRFWARYSTRQQALDRAKGFKANGVKTRVQKSIVNV